MRCQGQKGPRSACDSPLCQIPSSPSIWHEAPERAFLWLPLGSGPVSPSRGRLYWVSEMCSATAILETQDAGPVAGSIIRWCLKLPKGSSRLKTGHSHKPPLNGRRRQSFSQGHWGCSLGLLSHCPCDHSDQAWTPHPTSGVTFGRFEDNLSCVKSGELGQSLQMWPGN